jgi:predicted HTH transcriptional regulator
VVNKYIQQLIDQGEHEQLDFKFEISDAKKIARTCSAFANTKGGKLLIGVKDNGTIAGIRTEEEEYMIESAAHIFCRPRVEYRVTSWQVDGKQILEITIEESVTKPHLAPWKADQWRAFIRIKDENFVANSIQVAVWKKLHTETPTLVKYKKQEELLLQYLRSHDNISLNQFCKMGKLKYPIAKKIMVNLITIGVLKIEYLDNIAVYQLDNENVI